jgi:putative hydrolase of the HAD superfamily
MGKPQVKAVLWDFGGVITTSPFDAFAAYEAEHGLAPGFIRQLNATNPHANAWARFERSEISAQEFAALFEAEAEAAGGRVDAAALMSTLRGELRPNMVRAVERCQEHLKTGLLTNNFITARAEGQGDDAGLYQEVLHMFDVVVESSKVGCRKPDLRFYEMACDLLGIDPTEAVFLDDLGVNLKPARQMGMHTIKVTDADAALAELQGYVDFDLGA